MPQVSTEQASFPAGRQSEPVETPAVDQSAIERLVIPGLEVDARVVAKLIKGDTWDIAGLRADVAWLEGTSHPAAGGNTVLAAHIMVRGLGKGPFRYLDRLKAGDVVLVYSRENLYVYKVREQVLVKETDSEVTLDTGRPQLTLLTCSNWDTSAETYQRRRAVFADLLRTVPNPDTDAAGLFETE
jgi:sortase A